MHHLNSTFNEPGGQNVRVTRQMVELDTKYGVKFEVLNTGADGLSLHKILNKIPSGALKQLGGVTVLNKDGNGAYPFSIQAIQEA